ncbi:hypothetical protein IAQ61_005975 [Plenodomus lingam]|uniref:uncharacterized protein n=1 Tax=Leptosphaeria maculans TaxID=5022 RepID=UPI003333B7B7|nr:hypothetical protein IAQ61_005975 [Plenodomus lingam]
MHSTITYIGQGFKYELSTVNLSCKDGHQVYASRHPTKNYDGDCKSELPTSQTSSSITYQHNNVIQTPHNKDLVSNKQRIDAAESYSLPGLED